MVYLTNFCDDGANFLYLVKGYTNMVKRSRDKK